MWYYIIICLSLSYKYIWPRSEEKKNHIVFFLLCKVNIESWRAYACQRITFSFLNRLREKTEQIAAMKWWQTLYKNADNHCKKNADKHCTKMLTNIVQKCWQPLYKNADKRTKMLTNIAQKYWQTLYKYFLFYFYYLLYIDHCKKRAHDLHKVVSLL